MWSGNSWHPYRASIVPRSLPIGCYTYSPALGSRQEATIPPGLSSSSLDLLDAAYDPGEGKTTRLIVASPVACGYSHTLGHSQHEFSGLVGFSVLHFTSQS